MVRNDCVIDLSSDTESIKLLLRDLSVDDLSKSMFINPDFENDAPIRILSSRTMNEDTQAIISLSDHFRDPDNDDISLVSVTTATGFVYINGLDISFIPNQDFNGTAILDVVVQDSHGAKLETQLEVQVSPVDDNPTAPTLSFYMVSTEQRFEHDILQYVTDVDGDDVSLLQTYGSHGVTSINLETGLFNYVPLDGFSGEDTFAYLVKDSTGLISQGQITINVIHVNLAPEAGLNTARLNEDSQVVLDVIAEATDPNGDTLSIAGVSQGAHGQVTIVDGKIVYTPNANFNGTDTFTYTLTDGNDGQVTETVNVVVDPVNDAPERTGEASDLQFSIHEDNSLTISSLSIFTKVHDPDSDKLEVSSVTHGQNGKVTFKKFDVWRLREIDPDLYSTDALFDEFDFPEIPLNAEGASVLARSQLRQSCTFMRFITHQTKIFMAMTNLHLQFQMGMADS